MELLKKINEEVYRYYPRNVRFNSPEYHLSKELKNQLYKRDEALKNGENKNNLDKNLKKIFTDYQVMDWTDLKNYNCYEYRILLHKNQDIMDDDISLMNILGNERGDLFLFVSVLENYYYIQMNKTYYNPNNDKWSFETENILPNNLHEEIQNLKLFLASINFIELPSIIVNKKIVDIETELKSKGEASVFDCFFTDLIAINL